MAVHSYWILAGTGTCCRISRPRASRTCSGLMNLLAMKELGQHEVLVGDHTYIYICSLPGGHQVICRQESRPVSMVTQVFSLGFHVLFSAVLIVHVSGRSDQ